MGNLDLDTTFRAILAAARAGKYITYQQIADANGVEWNEVFNSMRFHLDDLMVLADSHGWPLFTAIVVSNKTTRSGTLSRKVLSSFTRTAERLGYEVTEPAKFAIEQQDMTFNWASYMPNVLFITPVGGKRIKGKLPTWSRKELILVLDLYLKNREQPYSIPESTLIKYSNICRKMQPGSHSADEAFRSVGSMKSRISNYVSCDPYSKDKGVVGLKLGTTKDVKNIWSELSGYPEYVSKIAKKIILDAEKAIERHPSGGAKKRTLTRQGKDMQDYAIDALEEWLIAHYQNPRVNRKNVLRTRGMQMSQFISATDSDQSNMGFYYSQHQPARLFFFSSNGQPVFLYTPYEILIFHFKGVYTDAFLKQVSESIIRKTGVNLWRLRAKPKKSYIEPYSRKEAPSSKSGAISDVENKIDDFNAMVNRNARIGHNMPPESIESGESELWQGLIRGFNEIGKQIRDQSLSPVILSKWQRFTAYIYRNLDIAVKSAMIAGGATGGKILAHYIVDEVILKGELVGMLGAILKAMGRAIGAL